MGMVHAEIELINGEDLGFARKKYIGEDEVKRITVTALVDTGCYYLAINENIQKYLQLPVIDTKRGTLANGELITCDIVSPILLRFKNRTTTCDAWVLPGDSEVLLGAIPLENMDVIIDPLKQELDVHPDRPGMAQFRL